MSKYFSVWCREVADEGCLCVIADSAEEALIRASELFPEFECCEGNEEANGEHSCCRAGEITKEEYEAWVAEEADASEMGSRSKDIVSSLKAAIKATDLNTLPPIPALKLDSSVFDGKLDKLADFLKKPLYKTLTLNKFAKAGTTIDMDNPHQIVDTPSGYVPMEAIFLSCVSQDVELGTAAIIKDLEALRDDPDIEVVGFLALPSSIGLASLDGKGPSKRVYFCFLFGYHKSTGKSLTPESIKDTTACDVQEGMCGYEVTKEQYSGRTKSVNMIVGTTDSRGSISSHIARVTITCDDLRALHLACETIKALRPPEASQV